MIQPGGERPSSADALAARRRQWLRWLLLVAGSIGLVLVTRAALTADESPIPSPTVTMGALALQAAAGVAAARAWVVLLGHHVDARHVRGAMYESQLSKYIPGGGVLQAAGQVTLSTSDQLSTRRSALCWMTSVVLTVVAGATLLSMFALLGGLTGWARAVALLGAVSLVAVDPRVLSWVLTQARRVTTRIPEPTLLPSARELRLGLVWIAAGFLLLAISFTIILVDLDSNVRPVEVLPAFVAAWLVGFLLVPLPAGLGAREAVLVAMIPGSTTGLLLAASLGQRVLALAAEIGLVVGHRLAHRSRGRPPT